MNLLSQRLINEWQGGFPLCPQPFALVAEQLESSEALVLETLRECLSDGTLTRFGPLYQIERLGGAFSLAALSAPAADFERIAALVNAFPEVAHNYQRNHALNMWFVLATETADGIADALARISAATGLAVRNFPKEREYALELRLQMDGTHLPKTQAPDVAHRGGAQIGQALLDEWRPLVLATQAGLPVIAEPYHALAAQLGWSVEAVLSGLQSLLELGAIRRIGVVPNHYRIGYIANGMTVWDVEDARVDALGEQIGALDFVTHCYRRPRHRPDWPYNFFAMVHGMSREAVVVQAEQIAQLLGTACHAHDILYSTRILKKTGLRLA